jgi:1-acyl-sn-glycerol-3-phosphate acyltransferase
MRSRFVRTLVGAFELGFRPWMRRRLSAVCISPPPFSLPAGPLILAANHVSWWDGFVLRELQRRLRPGAPLFTLVAAPELARHRALSLMGGVGIDGRSPGSVSAALRSLSRAVERRPDSVIAFFPQGRIWPSWRRPLGFHPGVELFARRLGAAVVPVGIHAEPLNRVAPTFFVSAGEAASGACAGEIERRVTAELDVILRFLAEQGEEAAAAWPPRAEPLPRAAAR